MNKIFSTLLVLLCLSGIILPLGAQTAQPEKPKQDKPVIIRDRFMFDIFQTFWVGAPVKINPMKFNPGFNISAMWDFKLPNKSPLSFGLGLGFTYYTQFSDAVFKANTSNVMQYFVIPEEIDFSTNKITYANINIPLEFRYRHSNGFKISAGVRLGLTTGISYRYKGLDPSGTGVKLNYKSFEIYNKEKFNFDVYLRTGWKAVGIYACYQVTHLFQPAKGPQINPFSVGLTVNFF